MTSKLEDIVVRRFRDKFPEDSIMNDETQSCLAFGFECCDGWFSILYEALLLLQDEKFTITQIKEKFGSLRVYTAGGNTKVNNILDYLEKQSEITCELCGSPGSIDRSQSWKMCRCDNCKEKKEC